MKIIKEKYTKIPVMEIQKDIILIKEKFAEKLSK